MVEISAGPPHGAGRLGWDDTEIALALAIRLG
jgi:hypothetical protein